jgi:hypothetical protein
MFAARYSFVLIALVLEGCSMSASDQNRTDYMESLELRNSVQKRVSAMEREIQIIKNGRLYLLVDLRDGEILLKIRGSILKRIPVQVAVAPDRTACPSGIGVLTQKDTASQPARPTGNNELDVLQLHEMPVEYALHFNCESHTTVAVFVSPLHGRWRNRISALSDGVVYRLRSLTPGVGNPDEIRYQLYLNPEDAQELYWALSTGDFALFLT